jgi:hypothetical protein
MIEAMCGLDSHYNLRPIAYVYAQTNAGGETAGIDARLSFCSARAEPVEQDLASLLLKFVGTEEVDD